MNEEMEKMAGKELEVILSHRCAMSPDTGLVILQLNLDGYTSPLNIALPPDQAKAVSKSLMTALDRLQSIQ